MKKDRSDWPLSLSTIACDAAIELDNLLLGKKAELTATNKLITWLEKNQKAMSVPEAVRGFPLADISPSIAVMLNNLLAEFFRGSRSSSDLCQSVPEIAERMEGIIHLFGEVVLKNPNALHQAANLISFCLNVSKESLRRETEHLFCRSLAA